MDVELKGKRALVTGSTTGIGFETARALAREGAHVIVNGRTQARVNAAVERLRSGLSDAVVNGIAADLSGSEGCRGLTERLPEVDVLVNNLGIFELKPFEQISDADWLPTPWNGNFSRPHALPRCCNASPRRTRWPP